MLARLEASPERRRKNRGHARKEIRRMRPGKNYDEAALLEEARRELEREECRFQDSMRTIRWWSAGCLAVTTLHGALPYGLLEGLDSGAARGVTACVIVSLCGWAWAAWGSVRRLRPPTRPARSDSLQQAYLQGNSVDARPALREIWGDPDNADPDEGVIQALAKQLNSMDKNAVEVYNLVRRACVVTGLAAITAFFVVVLG